MHVPLDLRPEQAQAVMYSTWPVGCMHRCVYKTHFRRIIFLRLMHNLETGVQKKDPCNQWLQENQ